MSSKTPDLKPGSKETTCNFFLYAQTSFSNIFNGSKLLLFKLLYSMASQDFICDA